MNGMYNWTQFDQARFDLLPLVICSRVFWPSDGFGEQGWRSGESTHLPPMWPGFDSRTRRHMWVEFVVGSLLCSERFSPGTPVFPSPQKPTFLNSNSIRNARAFNTWAPGSGDWATTPHAIKRFDLIWIERLRSAGDDDRRFKHN